jgi:hypothetical protein
MLELCYAAHLKRKTSMAAGQKRIGVISGPPLTFIETYP